MIPQEFQIRGVSVTFSVNICTRKSEFLFIYENKFTTHQKLGGHLLFPVNSFEESQLSCCEWFCPFSEVVFSPSLDLSRRTPPSSSSRRSSPTSSLNPPGRSPNPEKLHSRLLLIWGKNYIFLICILHLYSLSFWYLSTKYRFTATNTCLFFR